MRKAAELGRGSFTYVSRTGEVQARMSALFRKLERPVLRDIEVSVPGAVEGESWPRRIPDLYAGEPVMVAMKLDHLPHEVTVSGRTPAPWQATIPVTDPGRHRGIATVWAREKIEALMDRIVRGDPEAIVKAQVLDVALTHHLVSRYTSFVAVDRTPARMAGAPLVEHGLPNHSPHGFEYPQTALGLERLWLLGSLCLVMTIALLAAPRVARRG